MPRAYSAFGRLYLSLGKEEDAKEMYEKVLEINGGNEQACEQLEIINQK